MSQFLKIHLSLYTYMYGQTHTLSHTYNTHTRTQLIGSFSLENIG